MDKLFGVILGGFFWRALILALIFGLLGEALK